MSDGPLRILPRVTERNAHFWQGGAEGALRFLRCGACATWIHPPQPRCPECLGESLVPKILLSSPSTREISFCRPASNLLVRARSLLISDASD